MGVFDASSAQNDDKDNENGGDKGAPAVMVLMQRYAERYQ